MTLPHKLCLFINFFFSILSLKICLFVIFEEEKTFDHRCVSSYFTIVRQETEKQFFLQAWSKMFSFAITNDKQHKFLIFSGWFTAKMFLFGILLIKKIATIHVPSNQFFFKHASP